MTCKKKQERKTKKKKIPFFEMEQGDCLYFKKNSHFEMGYYFSISRWWHEIYCNNGPYKCHITLDTVLGQQRRKTTVG